MYTKLALFTTNLYVRQNVQNSYAAQPAFYSVCFRGLFLQVKRVGCETDQSHLS
jgi:hypothetical protein